jgi:O-antigen ligase
MVANRPLLRFTPQAFVVAGGLAAAMLAGVLLAQSPVLGLGFLAAVTFVPLAFINPPLALAGWLGTAFLSGIPGTHGAGSNYALLIVALAWFGALAGGRTGLRALARDQVWALTAVIGFAAWVAITLAWAPNAAFAGNETVFKLVISVVGFLMVATLVTRPEHARWIAGAFVAGTALSILAGVAGGGLDSGAAADSAVSDAGRLQGASQDPNYLAAAIVPAIMLAAGLAAQRGRPLLRLGLGVVVAVLAVGLAATESRGGFLAAIVVLVGALIVWRGQRRTIAALTVVLVSVVALWFAASPGSWERVTNVADGGSGRSDIWQVAWRVAEANPIAGVGVGQFPVVSPDYLRRPGAISRVDLLINKRIVVHNTYLQLWAETGMIGLVLFLSVAWAALAASWRAARRFEEAGDQDMTAFSRAVLLATLGALTASIFLSNVDDRRLWVLLALGPALLGIARRVKPQGGPTA